MELLYVVFYGQGACHYSNTRHNYLYPSVERVVDIWTEYSTVSQEQRDDRMGTKIWPVMDRRCNHTLQGVAH